MIINQPLSKTANCVRADQTDYQREVQLCLLAIELVTKIQPYLLVQKTLGKVSNRPDSNARTSQHVDAAVDSRGRAGLSN